MKKLLTDCNFGELMQIVGGYGEKAFRAKQFYDWILDGARFSEMTNIPQELLFKIAADYAARGVDIASFQVSKLDGTRKYLFKLQDGNVIEGVLMRYEHGNTVCVSSQVGCAMDCQFCASGLNGLSRNLSPGEIFGQVVAVNRQLMREHERAVEQGKTKVRIKRAVANIVFMGGGEPFDNYDNLVKALKLLIAPDGFAFSQRAITISTSGQPDKIRRLADEGFNVNLTVSLHAPNDNLRRVLMPSQKETEISDIINAAKYYFSKTGRRFTFEYVLISGLNDSTEHAKELADLVRGLPVHINIINLNPVGERGFRRSDARTARQFIEALQARGVAVTVRRSLGADIDGACGQLRNRVVTEQECADAGDEFTNNDNSGERVFYDDEDGYGAPAAEPVITETDGDEDNAYADMYAREIQEEEMKKDEDGGDEPKAKQPMGGDSTNGGKGASSDAGFDLNADIDTLFDDVLKDFIATQQADKESERNNKK